VAFTNGNSGAARPWRAMSDGNGHTLQYNIYQTDGTTIWDQTNPVTSTQTGTGSLTPSQMQSYVAKVNPAQATPPAGTYTDNVSVVISF
jgi:spore coat protein U-like protein